MKPRALLLPALILTTLTVSAQEESGAKIEIARDWLSKWTETQRIISKEKQEWRLGKESLQARTDLVRREIEALKQRIATAQESIADADRKRAELADENDSRKRTSMTLEEKIVALEQRALAMLPRLPEPLAERIRPLSQRLPETPERAAEAKLSLSERYQNVIGVLNDISKWNREITVMTEVRQMTDGKQVQVAVIYFGLGQGYYTGGEDKDGKPTVGGVGSSTADGWTWKATDHLAEDIKRAIAIYRNEQLATLVRLPVQIL